MLLKSLKLVFVLALLSFASETPKNIILFIGDGMGPAQITALKTVTGTPNLERFKNAGFATTYSEDEYVTDSAAGATALATGFKTYNGAISVDAAHQKLKTVLEYAEELGKSTGLVATCSITHATPAAFAAHQPSRKMNNEIADDITASGTDVIIGGGLSFFLPKSADNSAREDEKDLFSKLKSSHNLVNNDNEFKNFHGKNLVYLYAKEHPGKANERTLSLKEMTSKAIEVLSQNDNGFFLMVEGSQIDWGGHANESDYIISEIVDFDGAVGAGLDFAEKNKETMIVVTADHETGGYSLLGGSIAEKKVTKTEFTTKGHSAVMVPVFSFGPGSDVLTGIIDNTLIGKTIIKYNQN
ncbi:MAG: alkaline phosphatase [Calditrichae bacterium]|nr:alkaline phosphatase [Calditrichota bacterium]MCB9058706.1 alkaline phosphatase [Calditrichia bacterium]